MAKFLIMAGMLLTMLLILLMRLGTKLIKAPAMTKINSRTTMVTESPRLTPWRSSIRIKGLSK